MSHYLPSPWLSIAVITSVFMLGCSSGPSALKPPSLDPESAADGALELYDQDGDQILNAEELKACPGLAYARGSYDRNNDSNISRDEIVQRLTSFVKSQAALFILSAKVTLDGRPLQGAEIKFVPEPYLGDEIKTVYGVTGADGSAGMSVKDEELPENQRGIGGVQCGTYRVEITHPEISIPAKYNTKTTLGYETSFGQRNVTFALNSK